MGRVLKMLLVLLAISLSAVSCQSYQEIGDSDSLGYYGLDSGAATPDSFASDKGPVRGGVLNLFSTDPDTLNPMLTKNSYVSDFLSFVYEGLVKLDEKQQPVPVLSDAWDASYDGLVWNFHIRDGVKWQDGKPLTAYDVEFTVKSILSGNSGSVYEALLQNVATFAAVNSSSFRMVLKKPDSFTAEKMTFPIMPRNGNDGTSIPAAGDFKPVGTGPYKFVSRDQSNVILASNENWWYLKAGAVSESDMMYINEIRINIYKEAGDEIKAFQAGKIDTADINGGDFSKYNGRTDLIIKRYVSRDFEFLAFNLKSAVFSDPVVRKAVYSAVNRSEIISDVYHGNALESDLPIMPGSWIFEGMNTESVKNGDVAGILVQDGWKSDEKGYYKNFNGVKKYLGIEILVNSNNKTRLEAVQKICEQLKKAGFDAACTGLGWTELMARIISGKYDAACLGSRVTQSPDISYLYSNNYLPSLVNPVQDSAQNISGYMNADVNNYIERIFKETDRNSIKALYLNMKQKIDEDMPYIGLYFLENAVIYRNAIRGVLDPYTWNRYNDITRWYKPEY